MKIDMHIHTRFSPCSIIRVKHLLGEMRRSGIDGMCITDHNTIAARSSLSALPGTTGLVVILGIEYSTAQGDFLVFGPIDTLPRDLDALSLLRWVEKEGGVVIPAHPFRASRPADPAILDHFDIIEVLNGRNRTHENDLCREWIRERGNNKKVIGGSDAHTPEEIGNVVTVFKKNIYTPEDLIRELRDGDYAVQQRHN